MGSGKVSVLLPVYNMEDTIEESVVSVITQKDVVFELIIVNDGSTDNTFQILSQFQGISNVKLFSQSNFGKVAAFNRAYREASGDYFAFFAGDDILPENSLAKRKSLIESSGPNSVSCGKLQTFSQNPKFDNIVIPKKSLPNLSGGSIMFPKSIAKKIFPIPEELPNEDTWSRLIINKFASSIEVSNAIVLRYRIHNKNSIRKDESFKLFSDKFHARMKAYYLFYEQFRQHLTPPEEDAILRKVQLEELRYSGDTKALIFFNGVSLQDRIANIVYSAKNLYDLKVKYYRFLTGWRY